MTRIDQFEKRFNCLQGAGTSNTRDEKTVPTFECPTCGKLLSVERNEDAAFRPFCSKRCKLVDFGRWLDGTYNISEPITPEDLKDFPQDET